MGRALSHEATGTLPQHGREACKSKTTPNNAVRAATACALQTATTERRAKRHGGGVTASLKGSLAVCVPHRLACHTRSDTSRAHHTRAVEGGLRHHARRAKQPGCSACAEPQASASDKAGNNRNHTSASHARKPAGTHTKAHARQPAHPARLMHQPAFLGHHRACKNVSCLPQQQRF